MDLSSIEQIFKAFKGLKVLVVGDIMLDTYIYGKVSRISPEAPVPIVHVRKRENRLGGAGNVAINVSALGAEPVLFSVIGADPAGDHLLDNTRHCGLSVSGIVKSDKRPTTIKERIISGSQQMLRIDSETDEKINEEISDNLLKKLKAEIENANVLIFQDYDKGVLYPSLIREIISLAKDAGIPVVVDPKKRNFLSYQNVDLFKPNLRELQEGLKIEVNKNDDVSIRKAVENLRKSIKYNNALITLSDRGVYMHNAQEEHFVPAHIRAIADVSGAGDTVVSIAALCLALELPHKLNAELSNLGGGLVCEHLGAVPINREDLLREALQLNIHYN